MAPRLARHVGLELGGDGRNHEVVLLEHVRPAGCFAQSVVRAGLVDGRAQQRPELGEPHVDEGLVHAVEQHDGGLRQDLGRSQPASEVGVDDHHVRLELTSDIG
jgi:hypothetical protein